MPSEQKQITYRFSIGNLLAICTALAVCLAICAVPSQELEAWNIDLRWQQAILCTGATLLVYELLRQSIQLWKVGPGVPSNIKFALQVEIALRSILSVFISTLIFIRLLANYQIIEEYEPDGNTHVYLDFWPDLLMAIVLFLTLRIMLANQCTEKKPHRYTPLVRSVIYIGLCLITIYILVDRCRYTAIAHFAMDGIEKSHSFFLQRENVYPSHVSEGYQCFWISAGMSLGILLTLAIIRIHAKSRNQVASKILAAMSIGAMFCAAIYSWWFYCNEYPRISPDLYGVGSTYTKSDWLAGALLFIGLGTAVGLCLSRINPSECVTLTLNSSPLMLWSVILIFIGVHLWLDKYVSLFIREYANYMPFWLLPLRGWGSLLNLIYTFTEALLLPEVLLNFLLLITAIRLIKQTYKSKKIKRDVRLLKTAEFYQYSLTTLLLLAVAIPTLAIFSFCYYLGPLVL